MNKLFKIFTAITLLIISATVACVNLSACSKSGGKDSENDASLVGKRSEYNGVKVAFLDEDAFNNGEMDESRVVPELSCKLFETCYMIVDFDIQASENNDGRQTITASVKVQPASAVMATIQDTASGAVSKETSGETTELKAIYKIPEKIENVRTMRLIIKFEAIADCLTDIDISFKNSGKIQGVKTESIKKSAVMGYTEGLIFNSGVVTGISDRTIAHIVIPNIYNGTAITEVGKSAFEDSTYIESVLIPDSVTKIGSSAFDNCIKLQTVTLPKNITGIDYSTFARCSKLTEIEIPEKVTGIYSSAFAACKGLTNVSFPVDLKNIYTYAFAGCDSLTDVVLPDGLLRIYESAFDRCGTLKSITVPDSVWWFGECAFGYCENLTDIAFKGTMRQWESIHKDDGWDRGTRNYTVHCTDGVLTKTQAG